MPIKIYIRINIQSWKDQNPFTYGVKNVTLLIQIKNDFAFLNKKIVDTILKILISTKMLGVKLIWILTILSKNYQWMINM